MEAVEEDEHEIVCPKSIECLESKSLWKAAETVRKIWNQPFSGKQSQPMNWISFWIIFNLDSVNFFPGYNIEIILILRTDIYRYLKSFLLYLKMKMERFCLENPFISQNQLTELRWTPSEQETLEDLSTSHPCKHIIVGN